MNSPIIYTYTSFNPNAKGHGGEKRSFQISEIIKTHFPEIQQKKIEIIGSVYNSKEFQRNQKLLSYFSKKNQLSEFSNIFQELPIRSKINTNALINFYINHFLPYKKGLVIWEPSILTDYLLPRVLKSLNFKIIALPHNIESLVPNQKNSFTPIQDNDSFKYELESFHFCDRIFSISRSDQLILGLNKVNSDFLPYFPIGKQNEEFQELRAERTGHRKDIILLLGSATNPPTKFGMLQFLESIVLDDTVEIHIVGRGTEALSFNCNPKNKSKIFCHSFMDDIELKQILLRTRYLVVDQLPTTGALTRIPEFLQMGIPVAANPFAARDYYYADGVHIYNNINELMACLLNTPPVPKPIPLSTLDITRFINSISELLGVHDSIA